MATNTYVALDKVTVAGTSTTSITLSGIVGTYTDLRLVINSQNQNSTNQPYIQFNSDIGTGTSNYSTTSIRGAGATAGSGRHTSNVGWYPVPGPGVGTTGNFQTWVVDIMNYSNTSTFKSGTSRFNNAASIVAANVHTWRATPQAITSITITAEAGAGYLVPGSTFSLYGIRAEGIAPTPKATGGAIYSDSTYYYHAFGASGTFTPLSSLTADVLVVAGGGGGGYVPSGYTNRAAGGAGAGGLLGFASQSLTATGYSVTIGAGGNGGSGGTNTNGSNSQFAALTAAVGGGYGGVPGTKNANSGGSGGGGADNNSPGTGTSGQGFAGAGGFDPGSGSSYSGGGGGGATAAGSAGAANNGGAGGLGSSAYTSWATATGTGVNGVYATGGRGGSSATGNLNGTSAQANTGNGGGGSAITQNINGQNGGSGIVIVRYLKA
jgi:hypothetical protein